MANVMSAVGCMPGFTWEWLYVVGVFNPYCGLAWLA